MGSIADPTTFSFLPTKNIATGKGGTVASPHSDLLRRAKRFARQGLIREQTEFLLVSEGTWHQEVHEVGLNHHLTDMQAAFGRSQLARLSWFRDKRAEIKALYDAGFHGIEGVRVSTQRDQISPVWHLYPLMVPASLRPSILSTLRDAELGLQVNDIPAHRHPATQGLANPDATPVSEAFYAEEISLPIHTKLSTDDVLYIIEHLRRALAGHVIE